MTQQQGVVVVEIVEVAPRDGLQNEATLLPTGDKLELVRRAVRHGARRIEVTAFVRPDRVPQMADAEQVAAGLPDPGPGVRYTALVLNERGYLRARDCGFTEVNMVVLATETFSERNQGMPVTAALRAMTAVRRRAATDGVRVAVTVGASFGCPFEGEVPVARLATVLRAVLAESPDELVLADTIGVAVPTDVEERFGQAAALAPGLPLRAHFHDTRSTGVANAVAAVRSGVTALDASLAGIGGCPFAPAATGNVATEDLAYTLNRMGVDVGLDLPTVLDDARWLAAALGITAPGRLSRAGLFPSPV
ncbi:hydroxymethylglutaryl-CoA lyase [Solwaraspora sp. WMMD792]|uniref:hydroxymethylglutaryl-CoA lyase n=1 Tax=Solwaraspora sp. WMMD792 TaxID=3016099 RepID=UPI0024180505|nr:hydroxymethylglutaryl-CoA lyase [Solwaraspora sp. WMMD792]MDG4771039.1 hydroxymethylglutaryl-CoA lyase [Solwaraspora sp. WMMD792]